MMVHALSLPEFDLFDQFRQESVSLPEMVSKRAEIDAGRLDKAWSIIDGIVVHKGRIFLAAMSTLWGSVLEHAHGMGHEDVQKTPQRLRQSFFTPQVSKLVREFIHGCSICQRNKTEHLHPAGLLQPLAVPNTVWADIAMDFIEGFPKVGGKSVILMVVDHFIALSHPYSAVTVVTAFFEHVIRL
jgi:hypothetical protein